MTDTAHSYDAIAKQYRDSKLLPFRHAIERYTVFRELGDLRGRTVLDLACGEGIYAGQDRFWDLFVNQKPLAAFAATRPR